MQKYAIKISVSKANFKNNKKFDRYSNIKQKYIDIVKRYRYTV